jgi:hypothetical protein
MVLRRQRFNVLGQGLDTPAHVQREGRLIAKPDPTCRGGPADARASRAPAPRGSTRRDRARRAPLAAASGRPPRPKIIFGPFRVHRLGARTPFHSLSDIFDFYGVPYRIRTGVAAVRGRETTGIFDQNGCK